MILTELRKYCLETIKQHPGIELEVVDIYVTADDEIDSGASECNECELAMSSIKELIAK